LPELELTLPEEVELELELELVTPPVEVETLPDDVELELELVTPPVLVETPPVEVETPPVEVETPPVEVVELEVIPPVVVVLVRPPVEVDEPPLEVEVEPPVEVKPPVEVDELPPEDEVEVEPPEVVVETTTEPLEPPLPPKNPPKKPPPKPKPPEPPITVTSPPPPEGVGIGGSCGSIGSAASAICCGSGVAQLTDLVITRRIFFCRGAWAVRTTLRFIGLACLACLTYWTWAAGASATCTAPPPTTAPPAAIADNFTRAIRTDIGCAFFCFGLEHEPNSQCCRIAPIGTETQTNC
jgi:hypothetical protein